MTKTPEPGDPVHPPGRVPTLLEMLVTFGPEFESEAPPDLVRAAMNQALAEARDEAVRARDAGLAERPAGRAMDGLADTADWVLVSPRTGAIERYRAQALEVETAYRTLNVLIDGLLESTDDWLAHDPTLGADEFERLQFANAQETIFQRVKETAGEVASAADRLRSLL